MAVASLCAAERAAATGMPACARPCAEQETPPGTSLGEIFDGAFASVLDGRWLDPQDPQTAPQRGERIELGVMMGGEGALGALASDTLPTVGGAVVTGVVRYYPVDRLAVVAGVRSYVGIDGVPAAGTTASSVASVVTGARYDLVRENRFSLMWDLYSGPSFFAFADAGALRAGVSKIGLGGEMGTGLSARYSIGAWTGEVRASAGGRAGAAAQVGVSTNSPFAALYASVDVGLTWGFL